MSQNISAQIIADSIAEGSDKRMTTFVIEYPRFILAELNTHRMLSKNSASSRAIPSKTMREHIEATMAKPVFWGKNQPGMQAKEELTGEARARAEMNWNASVRMMLDRSKEQEALGLHKQIANRPLEFAMTMRTVISGTEFNNLWHLRDHEDAQPEFRVLASKMRKAYNDSTPIVLKHGEWHLPFVTTQRSSLESALEYLDENGNSLPLEDARIISASCCAQVSYRKSDSSLEKARNIYAKLIESTPAHASPVEHQATPMPSRYLGREYTKPWLWEPGITHVDRDVNYWSGNLCGWIQFRKLIPNEAVKG